MRKELIIKRSPKGMRGRTSALIVEAMLRRGEVTLPLCVTGSHSREEHDPKHTQQNIGTMPAALMSIDMRTLPT